MCCRADANIKSLRLSRPELNTSQSAHATPLRKHAYSNILKISPPKTENFQIKKNLIFFIILLKT